MTPIRTRKQNCKVPLLLRAPPESGTRAWRAEELAAGFIPPFAPSSDSHRGPLENRLSMSRFVSYVWQAFVRKVGFGPAATHLVRRGGTGTTACIDWTADKLKGATTGLFDNVSAIFDVTEKASPHPQLEPPSQAGLSPTISTTTSVMATSALDVDESEDAQDPGSSTPSSGPDEERERLFVVYRDAYLALARSGTTVSDMTRDLEEFLLAFYGIELRTNPDPAKYPASKLVLNKNISENPEWQRKITKACDIPMLWKMDKHEYESCGEYQDYLGKVLAELAPGQRPYRPYIVHDRRKLLNISSRLKKNGFPNVPFGVRGTTDVLVGSSEGDIEELTSASKDTSPSHIGNVTMVIQLKKPKIKSYDRYMWQSTLELFATDRKSDSPMFAVLSDLEDDWTVQWLATDPDGTPVLYRFRFNSKKEALTALACLLKNSEDSDSSATFRRVKVRDLEMKLGASDSRVQSPAGSTVSDDEEKTDVE